MAGPIQPLLGAGDLDEVGWILMTGNSDPGGRQVLQRLQLCSILSQNEAVVFLRDA